MTQNTSKIVRIDPKAEKKTLSAAQKQFNSLTKQIDRQKKLLLEWQATIPIYHQKVDHEHNVLLDTFNNLRLTWIQTLDQFYDKPLFKKTDKLKIKHLICDICEDLIHGQNSEEVKSLFNKYSDDDYDTINEETESAIGELMKGIAKNMFDVDLGDDFDISSPEKFQAHLQEKLREKAEGQPAAAVKPRKKTKKQLAKEARQQEEDALASKSVQEVYRKLVAVLHPDREPDAQERERKTELMQRVNTAYDKKDLLQLLELQLEVEQIDAAQLSQMADSRLKYFNKILKDQLAELGQEIYQIEHMFTLQLNMRFYDRLSPQKLLLSLNNDIRQLQADIVSIKQDIDSLENPAAFKAWLKTYKIPKNTRQDDFDDLFFGGMMPFDFR
ncbi:MAG: J domain-containing protein [Methylovulum sp.]|nr:J domain-containing protein [Methylovulum sp.]